MTEAELRQILGGWLILSGLWAFVLFGFDKWRAGRGGRRVSESALWWTCALGGWLGGFAGLVLFRHKSAKASFQLKFAAAFFVWAGLLAGTLKLAGAW